MKSLPLANPLAGVELGCRPGERECCRLALFAAEPFYAAALGIAVASVSAGTLSFFVCHEITSPLERFAGTMAGRIRNGFCEGFTSESMAGTVRPAFAADAGDF